MTRVNQILRCAGLLSALTVALCLQSQPAHAQAIYGTVTGVVADDSDAGVPGATVSLKNEATGLDLEAVADETGTYTVRNVTAGPYTLRATLQGFKEFVQTGIPVTPGGIVRVNARLEVGALTESVTVTTEAALLKTDKADVSVDLRPEDVVNLPLNQYRNYQYLMNLVPGATPPALQNAQTDTPGRALSTNVNGTSRNTNTTRIDGAASINVWLPHHAGYIAPVETVENVNIATNSFDAATGMAGGAAMSVSTKSGTNNVRGSAFYFRNQDELNARQGYFDPTKLDASTSIMGGTVGGPILRNRLFYFGGWERNLQQQSRFDQYTVPTAKMRNGDFSEVLAFNPNFRIYDPRTGNPTTGAGRDAFPGAVIPADRITSISRTIQALYPAPNNAGTNNGLQNNLFVDRFPEATRDNYDGKINWNRTSAHQIWAKYSMMDASVQDLFYLPFDNAGGGDTQVYLGTVGQTWTLSPTLILDGNAGFNIMKHQSQGPDFGTDYGLDVFGIPGTNSAGLTGNSATVPERHSGMPAFDTGLRILGNNSTWTPVVRDERSYTATINLTKVAGRHEVRTGFDFVRLQLNHWQPEVGNPRGTFSFGGGITGIPGYAGVGGWNSYASFLLGQVSSYGKSVQFEELTGRENQFGLYVADRWQVNEKLTLNLGLRYENYPLMSRADRGLEVLELDTFNVRLGGLGGNPDDLGIKTSNTLFAPRLGAAYRLNDATVLRAGYGRTFNPLPWSRPLRGRYPATIAYTEAGPNGFIPYGNLAQGIPGAPNPDVQSGNILLPRGVVMNWPDPDNVKRGSIHSWNVFAERRLPLDLALSAGYVGTATRDSYGIRNLNYAEFGGNVNRQLFARAGNADINEFSSFAYANYHSLQMALNRPFKNGLLLKGAYTLSKALNITDEEAGAVAWNQPSQYERNYARTGYDRPHMLQLGFVYELPFLREATGILPQLVKNWQINGIGSWLSGTPFSVGGDNGLLQQAGGFQSANVTGELKGGFGEAGPDEPWYDPSQFSQPGNAWGNSGRNAFRGPSNWNLDFSLFRAFPIGSRRLELRAESQNVFNHAQWANPVTGLTDLNFMRIRTLARPPRTVQLGLRFQF
ncbi:MAG: TonB-dependent receptor [Acidobacteria bacterium]|nr:TonB-dependent receptor [Acidobacteriota bacterium]